MKKRLFSLFTAAAMLCMLMATLFIGSASPSAGAGADAVLSPGTADWLEVKEDLVYKDAEGNKIPSQGASTGYRYQPAIATAGTESGTVAAYDAPHVVDSGHEKYAKLAEATFMGKPIAGLLNSAARGNGDYIQYKVEGGSYVATMLIEQQDVFWGAYGSDTALSADGAGLEFKLKVSADGETWTDVSTSATYQFVGWYSYEFKAAKAVVQIPADAQYYRIVFPDEWWWNIYLGPSVASNNDLSKCDTLEEAFKEETVLAPGKYDWLEVSDELAWLDDSGNKIAAVGGQGGYRYKSAYATEYDCMSTLDKQFFQKNKIYAIDSSFAQYAGISAGKFMGKQITGAIASDRMWAGNYYQYRVEGGSYVATALILHENISANFFDENGVSKGNKYCNYGFQVSADGENWTTVTADVKFESYGVSFWIYKAVVHIPADCQYYRVVLPGFDQLDAGTGWHNSADDYFWRVFAGPTVASKYDLTQYSTLTAVPDSPEYVAVENKGAQVRGTDAAGNTDLRFAFDLKCAGVKYAHADPAAARDYSRDLSAATVAVGKADCKLVDFGAILSLKSSSVEDKTGKKLSGENLYDLTADTVTYTAVITNIPETARERVIYARPYYVYEDADGAQTVVYGDVISRSVADLD